MAVAGAALALALSGCAAHRAHRAPEPPPAPRGSHGEAQPARPMPPAPSPERPPRQTASRVVRDTLAVHAALVRCGGKALLPDQENIVDAARDLLAETRTALRRGELERARSAARNARQLVGSLNCR